MSNIELHKIKPKIGVINNAKQVKDFIIFNFCVQVRVLQAYSGRDILIEPTVSKELAECWHDRQEVVRWITHFDHIYSFSGMRGKISWSFWTCSWRNYQSFQKRHKICKSCFLVLKIFYFLRFRSFSNRRIISFKSIKQNSSQTSLKLCWKHNFFLLFFFLNLF